MLQITPQQLSHLIETHEPPCVSLYMPTHRNHPENRQDPIRYRNLLKEMNHSLLQRYAPDKADALQDRFRSLSHDGHFWNHRTDSLVVLASSDSFHVIELQRRLAELVIVADSFHVKPLLRVLQTSDRYQILGLNRHAVSFYEGNRDVLDESDLSEGVPATIEEALGEELTDPHLTVASYGSAGGLGGSHGASAMHHGHGQKKDEVENDTERFFRLVDRAVLEHHSRPTGLPLVLAALPEHHDIFRKISHNPFLAEIGIHLDPKSISLKRLREEAWRVVEPQYLERLQELVDRFESSRARALGSDELSEVGSALCGGRVATLLVEADRQIPARFDQQTGCVEMADLDDPTVDDLLDDFAEVALRMGGEVIVVPTERMPSTTGVAATYRF